LPNIKSDPRRSVKEKLRVILLQRGALSCPAKSNVATEKPTKPLLSLSLEQRAAYVREVFGKKKPNRPRTKKALKNSIHSMFQGNLTSEEIESLFDVLVAENDIQLDDKKVVYSNE